MGIFRKIITLTPYGKKLKDKERKKWAEKQIELDAKMLPSRIGFYKQLISPNDLVFDVGANIGNRIAAFLACGAKVIAIEPQPSCKEILEKKFGANIILEQVGLSDEDGTLDMFLSTDSTISTFNKEFRDSTKERFKHSEWDQTIKVPITTLDTLIDKHGIPDFCKIDVEGFELNVLRGLHKIIPIISFEYCVPEMLESNIACVNLLKDLSPTAKFNYSINESMQWALPEWLGHQEFIAHINSTGFQDTLFGDIYFKSV